MAETQSNIQNSMIKDNEITIPSHPKIIYLRKLYLLLACQLLFACGLCYVFYMVIENQQKIKDVNFIFYIALAVMVTCLLVGFVARSRAKQPPQNYVLYLLFVISFAVVFAFSIDVESIDYVYMALISLTIQAFAFFLYVITTKTELTYQGASVFIFGSLLITLEIFLAFTRIPFTHIVIVAVATIIWGYYLVYDTQSTISLSDNIEAEWRTDDDYFTGAMLVYMDVFQLLLRMADLLRQSIIKYR